MSQKCNACFLGRCWKFARRCIPSFFTRITLPDSSLSFTLTSTISTSWHTTTYLSRQPACQADLPSRRFWFQQSQPQKSYQAQHGKSDIAQFVETQYDSPGPGSGEPESFQINWNLLPRIFGRAGILATGHGKIPKY